MAAIKNVKYLNKECIYQYFHNPNEAFLEGFIVDENPIFCPRNCEGGVYIKIFKVPVNSRVNEIYMQEFRWEAWKNGYNTPLPSDYSNNFKKAGYSIDSTRFWSLPNYLISVCPKLKAELIDYQQQFEQAYCKKIIEELSFCHALSDGKETNERAEQYAIYTMLEGRPVHYNFLLLNAQSIVRNINYKSIVNYIIDEDGYLGGAMETLKDYVLRSLTLQGAWYSRRANEFPKRVAAARMADKMSPAFVFDDNESQRIAKSVSVYCARTLDARKNITIVIGNGNGNGEGITVKISCSNFFFYKPTTKEVFINVESAGEEEREKINQYVKDNGASVSENLVPIKFLQSVVSYGCEKWNPNYI